VGNWNEPLARLVHGIDAVESMDAPWLARDAGGAGWRACSGRHRMAARAVTNLGINLEGRHLHHVLMSESGAAWCAASACPGPCWDDDVLSVR